MRPLGLYSTEEDTEEIDVELRRARFDNLYPEPPPEPVMPEPVQAPPPVPLPMVEPAPAPPPLDPRGARRAQFAAEFGSDATDRATRRAQFEEEFGPRSNSILERYVTAPQTPEALDATVAKVAASSPRPAGLSGDIVPNQFDSGLSTEDAYASCGPVAAVAFARATGRNPSVAEARNLAAEVGWTPQRGMAGPRSQKALLDKMGVPALLTEGAPDWARVRADVESGNPVTISTPGHYFVAAGFDPDTGRFDFGHSGTALRGGKRWMTPAEVGQTGMGQPHAALYLDNPDTPQSSVAARPAAAAGQYAETDEGRAAARYGLDPDIFFRQISQESGGRATAVSPAGARGVGQFMPGTAQAVAQRMGGGVTAEAIMSDKQVGLDAAAFHMREMLDQYGGDYATALAAYNAGPGAVAKYGGVPPFAETQKYVSTILGGPSRAPRLPTSAERVAQSRPTTTVPWRTAPEPDEATPTPEPEPEPIRLTGDADRGIGLEPAPGVIPGSRLAEPTTLAPERPEFHPSPWGAAASGLGRIARTIVPDTDKTLMEAGVDIDAPENQDIVRLAREKANQGTLVMLGPAAVIGGPTAAAVGAASTLGALAAPGVVRGFGGTEEQAEWAGTLAGVAPVVPGVARAGLAAARAAPGAARAAGRVLGRAGEELEGFRAPTGGAGVVDEIPRPVPRAPRAPEAEPFVPPGEAIRQPAAREEVMRGVLGPAGGEGPATYIRPLRSWEIGTAEFATRMADEPQAVLEDLTRLPVGTRLGTLQKAGDDQWRVGKQFLDDAAALDRSKANPRVVQRAIVENAITEGQPVTPAIREAVGAVQQLRVAPRGAAAVAEAIPEVAPRPVAPVRPRPAAAAPARGVTAEAEGLLDTVQAGGTPTVITNNLRRIATENAIPVTPRTTPDELIAGLQAKARDTERFRAFEEQVQAARPAPAPAAVPSSLEDVRSAWLTTPRGQRYAELKEMYPLRSPAQTKEYERLYQQYLELGMSPAERTAWRRQQTLDQAEELAAERAAVAEEVALEAPEPAAPRAPAPARAKPDPATMTGSAINRELDSLEKRSSAAVHAVGAMGREDEGLGTLLRRLDPELPVVRNYTAIADRTRVLRDEIAARYGPSAPSRLPTHGRGFGPRRKVAAPAPEEVIPEPAVPEAEGVQRMYSGIPIPTPRFTRGPRAGMATEGLTPGEEAILYSAGQPTPRAPSEGFNPPRFARQKFVSADARLVDAQRRVERDYGKSITTITRPSGTTTITTQTGAQLPEHLRAVELRKMESGSKHRANLRVQDLKDAYRVADQHVPELEKALEFAADLDQAAAVGRRSGQDVAEARLSSGGRTPAESREGLRILERQLGPEGWATVQRAQAAVYQYVDGLRERLVQSGVWSKEFADQMRHEFPHYVPDRIWKYMDDPEFVPTGRKIGLNDNGIKKLTAAGTESERENVTDSLIRLAFESEQRAARNETARAVYGWRTISPELADVMRDVPTSYTATNDEVIHHLFDAGTKRTVAVNKSFAQALELGEPHKPLGIFSLPAAVTRTMAVEHNPLFAIAGNPLLDVPSYLAHSSALYGPQKLPVFVYELMRAVPDVFAGIAENRFSGPGLRRLLGSGGGQLGYYSGAAKEVEKLAREVRAGGGFVLNNPKDAAEWLWDVTPLVGTRMENISRVAAMRLAERAGADRLTVTMRGRAATMDFSEGGEWTKVMNSYIPFFNISTRPIPWLVNLAKQNPKAFAATMATGVIAPVALSEAWNRSDPERAAAYEQVPDYVKNQGMVIMAPEPTQGRDEQGRDKLNYVLVPMRNFTSILIPTRVAMERMMGDATPQEWQDAVKGIIGSSSPIQTDSATQALGNFVPNVVATALQLATDQDYFRGTRIASEYADERATALSKGIASVTGARPSQVEFAARDVGAGVAGMVLAGIDMATKALKRESTEPLNPALGERRFTGGLAGRFFRHQGGQVERDLSAARDSMRDQLLAEARADPRWATKSPQQQEGVERRIGEFATKVTYGTKTNPATILKNAQEYLRFTGATPQEMSDELAKLREALKEREAQAAPKRAAVQRELAGARP